MAELFRDDDDSFLPNRIRYKTLFENMAQGVVFQDRFGKIIHANTAAARILGLSMDQLQGRYSLDPRWKAIHEDGSAFAGETHPAMIALKTGKTVQDVMGIFHPGEGDYRWLSLHSVPLTTAEEKEPYQVFTTFEDITKFKMTEAAVRRGGEQYRVLTENMQDVVWILDTETLYFRYMSPSVERLRGYTPDEVMALPLTSALTKESADRVVKTIRERAEAYTEGTEPPDGFYVSEVEQPCKDGRTVWTEAITKYYRNADTGRLEIHGVTREIGARKKAELALQKSLEEKDLLMRELQHRVKNNLNMVNSLLSLESANLSDSAAKAVFQNARTRIQTMAGLYEKLYRSKETNLLDLHSYVKEFIGSIKDTYVIDPEGLRFEQNIDEIRLDLKRAVPVCLILNELLANALKYAYPPGKTGSIEVSLKKADSGDAVLSVSDHGTGFPAGFDAHHTDSMGLMLVRLLSDQLEGSLEIESKPGEGARLTISFPLHEKSDAS